MSLYFGIKQKIAIAGVALFLFSAAVPSFAFNVYKGPNGEVYMGDYLPDDLEQKGYKLEKSGDKSKGAANAGKTAGKTATKTAAAPGGPAGPEGMRISFSEEFDGEVKARVRPGGKVQYVKGRRGKALLLKYDRKPQKGKRVPSVLSYNNTAGRYVAPYSGTVQLWVKPTRKVRNDEYLHRIFSASALGGHTWTIAVFKKRLYAWRDFDLCVRSINASENLLKSGQWHKLTLSWRGNVTKFLIDGQETGRFWFTGTKQLPPNVEYMSVGDNAFAVDDLTTSIDSLVGVGEFVKAPLVNIICPNRGKLISEDVQETYRGIKLHAFADAASRQQVKALIALMPKYMADSIGHVVLLGDRELEEKSHTASAVFSFALEQTIFLKDAYFGSARKIDLNARGFFHEVAHGYTYKRKLNYGGPNGEKSRREWALLSGIDAYGQDYSKAGVVGFRDGFVSSYGSTMPDEDLAEWVAVAYDLYLRGETFSSLLRPGSMKYGKVNQRKIDFLFKKGFITRKIYDRVATPKKNVKHYTWFND